MKRAMVVASLLAVAGVCGFFAYAALSRTPHTRDRWAQAAAAARRAEHTKGQLPAMQVRDQAAILFQEIARSGPLETRSQAAMLAGLLRVRNASADPTQSRDLLIAAGGSLRESIRLDAQNDDAAYDLELLLSQARATGRPLSQQSGTKHRQKGDGRAAPGEPGTGY